MYTVDGSVEVVGGRAGVAEMFEVVFGAGVACCRAVFRKFKKFGTSDWLRSQYITRMV